MTLLSILLALHLSPNAHAALKHPSGEELRGIEASLAEVNRLRATELLPVERRLQEFRKKTGFATAGRYYLSELTAAELAQFAEASREYVRILKKIRPHVDSAVRQTLGAYGIADPDRPPSGTIRSGPPARPGVMNAMPSFIGQGASFKPTFSPSVGTPGHTGNDGRVQVGWGALVYPGKLAAILFHEQEHFRDLLKPRRDLRNDAAVELRIRSAQRHAMVSVFRLRQVDIDRYDQMLTILPAAREEWDAKMKEGWDPYREDHWRDQFRPLISARLPFDTGDLPMGGSNMADGLEDIQRGADALEAAVLRESEERRAREEERRLQEEGRQREIEGATSIFQRLSNELCQPGVMVMDGHVEQYRLALGIVPVPPAIADIERMEMIVSCPEYMRNRALIEKQRGSLSVTLDWIVKTAAEGRRREHDPRPGSWPRVAPAPPVVPPPRRTEPVQTPPPVVDVPDDGRAAPPSTPYCRYHDWCKDPEKK